MTQVELAELIGTSQPYVSMLERGTVSPSPLILARVQQALSLKRPEAESRHEAEVGLRGPEVAIPSARLSIPVRVGTWLRPRQGGDRILVEPMGESALWAAVLDVAGHGTSTYPAATYLQGWLRGRLQASPGVPRLDTLSDELAREASATGIEAAWFMCVVRDLGEHVVDYEGLCVGAPIPLLFHGEPRRAVPGAAEGTATRRPSVFSMRVPAPWTLVVATDGLLARLDVDETAAKRRLREMFQRYAPDEPVDRTLTTPRPVVDDEGLLVLAWDGWDLALDYPADDIDADRRALSSLLARVEAAIGAPAAEALAQAVGEATDNVRTHAYGGARGPLWMRLRIQRGVCTVEVRDEGMGTPPFEGGNGGIAAMRKLCDKCLVRKNAARGITVTLIKEA